MKQRVKREYHAPCAEVVDLKMETILCQSMLEGIKDGGEIDWTAPFFEDSFTLLI